MKTISETGRKILLAIVLGWVAQRAGVWSTSAAPSSGTTNRILIVELQGDVEVLSAGATNWVLTRAGQELHSDDHLRTGPNSRASLQWSGQSVVPLGPETQIQILPPSTPGTESSLHLFRGLLYFFHRGEPSRFRILSRAATAGIKGTEFVARVDTVNGTERTTFWVIDGEVELANEQGKRLLTNGQEAFAESGKSPQLQTAGFIANNILQWCLYYPAVLDLRDLSLSVEEKTALSASLTAYRDGDLLAALKNYSSDRSPGSDAERIYRAALLLAVGQVRETEDALAALSAAEPTGKTQRLANALRLLIAAVKREDRPSTGKPQLPTELLAASYYEQSRAVGDESLKAALQLARQAVTNSPEFGFAWARVAELEFSFGRTSRAREALDKSLALSPRNAQALALYGFVFAAQNKFRPAQQQFDAAIRVDAGLANAWLGRGLCRIRSGDAQGGREDLLVAAALEPQRALLRDYLGKAYADAGERQRARHELDLAKGLDPRDPTAWLYSALLDEQENRVNEAIRDLEKSQDLNDNRSLFRSELLLDQDRAVRSANLARIYDEAGLDDVALREASRAVVADYANFSAHLFLANSYEQLRQASPFELRFETPAFSEYLVASLLGPADGRILAQPVTQQEYTRFFDKDSLGFSSTTEYLSRGAWSQYASQFGTLRDFSYALEVAYTSDPGNGPRLGFETLQLSAKAKQMLGPNDGLFLQVYGFQFDEGHYAKPADPLEPVQSFNSRESQEPSILVGLDHRWSAGQHTLLLFSHINDELQVNDPAGLTYLLSLYNGVQDGFGPTDLTAQYQNHLTVNSLELQHLAHTGRFQTVAGLRLQGGTSRPDNLQAIQVGNAQFLESYFGTPPALVTDQSFEINQSRFSAYLYEYWKVFEPFWLIGGVCYDYLELPDNDRFAPINGQQRIEHQVSPKAGLVWNPAPWTTLRAAYSQSLGGSDLDQSVRLEPTQIAGFVQTYRNLFPDAIVGGVGGAHFTTYDASLSQRLSCGTYLAIEGQILQSSADHTVGAFQSESEDPVPINETERLEFEERSVGVSVHQLLGNCWSVGMRYRVSEAELTQNFPGIDPTLLLSPIPADLDGVLQTLAFDVLFRHPSGFYAGVEEVWWKQTLRQDLSSWPGEEMWQLNLMAGYRFPKRHVEITVGLLNATDRSYRFHPINLTPDLPQERTFFARLRLNF